MEGGQRLFREGFLVVPGHQGSFQPSSFIHVQKELRVLFIACRRKTMANIYSVEWMSQSIYSATARENRVENMDVASGFLRPDNPCAGQPSPQISCMNKSSEPQISPAKKKPVAEEPCKPYSPSSSTNSCGYTSGSESEVADAEGEAAPHRRMRTKFTSEQIYKLEKTFNKHRYLGATQRRKMAEKLHLSETQVKTWFQNRRMKLKREVQDLRTRYWNSTLPHVVLPRPLSFEFPAAHALYAPLGPPVFGPPLNPRHVHPLTFPPCFY
ncbi:homeobox protein vent1-like [Arapaima gigas]